MQIVVLDGHTLSPGDLDLAPLTDLGQVTLYPRTAPDEVLPRSAGADILLTNKVVLNRETLRALPNLKYVGVTATGFNVVDTVAARELGIPVTNVPAYSTDSVAQLTLGLILNLAGSLPGLFRDVAAGRWEASPDFAFWDRPLIELRGESLGIIGFGEIGKAVSKLALAFGMTVRVPDRGKSVPPSIRAVPMEELVQTSRFISLHCPLTDETRHLVNDAFITQMRSDAFLINTGRGPLVDDEALARALQEGRLAGAALDVLTQEPPTSGNPLIGAPNCLISPHIGWATQAARRRLLQTLVSNVQAFLDGKPVNVVNS